MKRLLPLIFVASFSFATPSAAGPLEDCAEYAEYGIPSNDGTLLCRMAFLLAHDEEFKTPIWVAERVTREKVIGDAVRKDNFKADPDLPKGKRSELTDYKGSGFDRGHMSREGVETGREGSEKKRAETRTVIGKTGPG